MSCTYIYNNKQYSKERLLRLLIDELPIQDQSESVEFLKKYLNLTDAEINIVQGLIDNRSLGRLQADGSVLLSDRSTLSTAKHEAFHRVWRMYLTPDEREFAIRDFKLKKGWSDLLDPYRKLYKNRSEVELIEEYFADEFEDFTLQPTTFNTTQPLLNFFQRIFNFLKQILGLKPKDINSIYSRILRQEFTGAPKFKNPYAVDQRIIHNTEFSVEQKNEIVSTLTQKFIKTAFDANLNVDDPLAFEAARIKNVLDVARYDLIEEMNTAAETAGVQEIADQANAIYDDLDLYLTDTGNSEIWESVKTRLTHMGFSISEKSNADYDEVLDDDVQKTREFLSSVEIDPYSSISTKIKMVLAAFTTTAPTVNYQFQTPNNPVQEFLNLAVALANTPPSEFMVKLASLQLPYQDDLFKLLETDIHTRNKLISQLSLTLNQFQIFEFGENESAYFFNANQNTAQVKLIRTWTANFVQASTNYQKWVTTVTALNTPQVSTERRLAALGIKIDPRVNVGSLVNTIYTTLTTAINAPNFNLDVSNPFKSLKIDGYVRDLANLQAQYETQTSLMIQVGDKKLYPLNLNTQQTTLLNAITYAQTKFLPEMSIEDRLEILKRYAPFITSAYHYSKVNGQIKIHNKWLAQILEGKSIQLVISYLGQNKRGDQVEFSDLDEPDLLAAHINGALTGVVMSMKHSDRSTFFAYKMEPLYGKAQASSVNALLDGLTSDILNVIQNEVRISKLLKDNNVAIQYITATKQPRGFEELLGARSAEVMNGSAITNSDIRQIRDVVNTKFKEFKEYVFDRNVEKSIHAETLRNFNNDLDLTLAAAFANETANHIYESMTFSGDLRVFKNGNDLFKRLSPQSSTGQLLVDDERTENFIRAEFDRTYEVLDPRTGETTTINTAQTLAPKGLFRAITLKEEEIYGSNLSSPVEVNGVQLTSKLTGKVESKLFMIFEYNFLNDKEIRDSNTDEELIAKIQLYEKKYKSNNENDGQSYMSLPAFKQYQIRLGNWNEGFELIYKIEMSAAKVKSLDELKDLEVEYRGTTFKPFQQSSFLQPVINNRKVKLEPIHTLKTQFAGYTIPQNLLDAGVSDLWFNTVLKTSQHVIVPTHVVGTNLQLMNHTMLSKGIDIIHMGSANKVGGIDPQIAATKNLSKFPLSETLDKVANSGLTFYNDRGEFNASPIEEHLDLFAYYGFWNQQKDQVKIGNKVKDEIKGSTQSLKIIVSNLLSDGVERFEGAAKLINEYKNVVDSIVLSRKNAFLSEIGYTDTFTNVNELKDIILSSTQVQNAPDNVRNSVINFFEDVEQGLESSPMKNKIENVLYALITNNIISFDRSGTSMPIAAQTGYEAFGSRTDFNKGRLKFYDAIFNEEGEIIEVTPAEIIMPLPSYWIKPLMKWAKETYNITNLIDALEALNAKLKTKNALVKGLRIPNQQLSSNDIYRIAAFTLPTFTNYIVVPTETVNKVGEDLRLEVLYKLG